MSENERRYLVAVFGLDHVVRLVADDAWDAPSPCEGWTAREVAGHAMGVVNNIAAKTGYCTAVNPFEDVAAIAGDDPAGRFRTIRNQLLEALDRDAALETPVKSSLGEMTMDDYLFEMTADTLIHTWDIARATGVDETLDPDLVRVVHTALVERDSPAMRSPGRYAAAVVADETNRPQDRLIAFTGRDPTF